MGGDVVWLIGLGVLTCVCVFAFWKGGRAEQIGSVLIFVANVLADVVWLRTYPRYPTMQEFGIDFALAFSLLFVAFKYSSLWLGAAMLLQSIALFSHALSLGGEGPGALAQVWINDLVSNLMLLCIVAGAFANWKGRTNSQFSTARTGWIEQQG